MIDTIAFKYRTGTPWMDLPDRFGRPRTRPVTVLADKTYSSRAIREHLRRRGIRAVIPHPSDRIANRKRLGRQGGRPPACDKAATIYRAALHLAAIHIWAAR